MGSVCDVLAPPMPHRPLETADTEPNGRTGNRADRNKKRGEVMSICRGSLVVHKDGSPVFCSEELAGRPCEGPSYERHRIFRSCGLTFFRGCPDCEGQETAASTPSAARVVVRV
jgi:hypothetical protein